MNSFLRWVALLGHLTWPTLFLAAVAVAGGTHPTDTERDGTLVVFAVTITLLNAPALAVLARDLWRGVDPRDLKRAAILVLRLAFAAAWLRVLASKNYEYGPKRARENTQHPVLHEHARAPGPDGTTDFTK